MNVCEKRRALSGKRIAPGIVLLLILCLPGVDGLRSAEKETGEDWPVFLGPRQDGTSAETGLLEVWPATGPPKVWERAAGKAYSAPVTSRGRLILFHRIRDSEVIESLEAKTGESRWSYRYPTEYVDRYGYHNGPRSSPTIDGDRIYTFGAEGKLTCLDFSSGRLVWQRGVNQEYTVPQGFFGVGTAPVIEGRLLLLNVGGPGGAGVVAFDKNNGKTVWKASDDGASYSTPVVRTFHGRRVAVFFTKDGLLGLDPETGRELYRLPFRSRIHESVNAASPVVVGDIVFVSATYNVGSVAVRLGAEGLQKLWQSRTAMQNHWATSIYHDGNLYGMDGRHEHGSNFRCIEFRTGNVRWTADEGLGRASFIMADGHFIALGERGDLALIEVNPTRYVEKSKVRMLRYPCWTPPVLSHGFLYLRNEDTLVCLNLREK